MKVCKAVRIIITIFVSLISVIQIAPIAVSRESSTSYYTELLASEAAWAAAHEPTLEINPYSGMVLFFKDKTLTPVQMPNNLPLNEDTTFVPSIISTTRKQPKPSWHPPPGHRSSPPTAPTVTGDDIAYANDYFFVTAQSTDPANEKIQYTFEWRASKTGATHIKETDYYSSGTPYADKFKYGYLDIGYTYTVEVTANDGYDYSYSTYFSFVVVPHISDLTLLTTQSKTPAPDINLFGIQPATTLAGSVTFNDNPLGSPFELYGAVGNSYIYVWAGLAALFIGLGIYAYYTYTGKGIVSTNMKRSLYRALFRSGIKGTERDYDYQLTYNMPEPNKSVSYRRKPVRRKVKW